MNNTKAKCFSVAMLFIVLLFVSCGKTCRCIRYDGVVDEFDIDELDVSCESLENQDYGTTYSLCERVH